MKTTTLPSGAELTITLAPFADSKALYQSILEELKSVSIKGEDEIGIGLLKDLFCAGFSSKKIEAAMSKCLSRCLYNGIKIDDSTWEPAEAREDYMKTLVEVAKENIAPFVKSLSLEFSIAKEILLKDQASRPKTTQS